MLHWKRTLIVIGLLITALAAGCASQGAAVTASPQSPTQVSAVPVTSSTVTATLNSPAVSAATSAPSAQSASPAVSGEIQYTVVPDKTVASYTVREQLANRDLPSDAVGKTSQVSGSVYVKPDGTIDSANSKIIVDAASLQTDQGMRDNFVRRNILQTSQYPNITFVPKTITGLPSPLPQSGQVKFQITGDLTILNTTKSVTWDVTGNIQNGQATGTATTSFKFEDFNIPQPRISIVLSIEDHITLQIDVTLQRANS